MDFKISISIPPDNPAVAQVDHTGVEYPSVQISKQDKFIQILNQAKHQKELEQIKLNEEKLKQDKEKDKERENEKEKEKEKQIIQQQDKPNPMIAFHEHKNMARIELEQLIYLIDMIRNNQISLNVNVKPPKSEIEDIWELTHKISHKQQSLNNVASKLKLGATKMKETINTMSLWWNDVSQLRTKWRLKGKDQSGIISATSGITSGGNISVGGVSNQSTGMQGLANMNKSNSKRLSIDYGYYTSGSFIEGTDADLSRGPNGEVNIDFPHLPYQASINKRLYINVKSSDSKTFYNHSSNLKKTPTTPFQQLNNTSSGNRGVNTPKTPTSSFPTSSAFNKLRQQQQLQLQLQQQQLQQQQQQQENPDDPEEIHRKFITSCTNQLNKAQKYQFNCEIFEQLSREVATLNISAAAGGAGLQNIVGTQTSPNIPPTTANVNSNIMGGNLGNMIGNQSSLSLTTSTGGENIMLTEKEIRIECGNFNLFIGMDNKVKDDNEDSTTTNNKPKINNINNNNNNKNIIYSDEEKNRLLFVLKTILKKISVLQLKRSQKQLTMNLSRRTPRIIFGKKSIAGHNDDVIFKITSIIKHMDTYLRVYKVLEIFEQKLPIRLKSTPGVESSSSIFILTLIDSCQNLKNPMVPIEISINQNKIEVVQGQNRSFSNKDEVILGSFIITLLKGYYLNNNIHPSHLDISGFDDNFDNDQQQQQQRKSTKKYKFSNNQSSIVLLNNNNSDIDDNNSIEIKSNRNYQIEKFFKSLVDDINK